MSERLDERLRRAAQTYRGLGNHTAESMFLEAFDTICKLRGENARLWEQMERLLTLLRNDCDIEASWDGLRRFWHIGLTESGCLMRDRACDAEAENAKLRELAQEAIRAAFERCDTAWTCTNCQSYVKASGCPLRLVLEHARELGVEVGE